MGKIAEALADPSWWFTAVVVGVLAGVAGGMLKDSIDRAMASRSKALKAERRARIAANAAELRIDSRDPVIVSTSTIRAGYLSLSALVAFIGGVSTSLLMRVIHPDAAGSSVVAWLPEGLVRWTAASALLVVFFLATRLYLKVFDHSRALLHLYKRRRRLDRLLASRRHSVATQPGGRA